MTDGNYQTAQRPAGQYQGPKWTRVLQIIGVILFIAAAIGIIFGMVLGSSRSQTSTSSSSSYKSTVEVLYEVEGTAGGVDVTLQSTSGTVQLNGKAVPLANRTTGTRGITYTMNRGSFTYISAQNNGASGTVTCRITVDGTVVSTNTSSGGYAIASCSG
ncbi:Flagellar hook-associated protein flgK [Arthrobacter sp. 9V]|uniref:MmpS family transport accessory protein n=1 Tax=Arthrobacter sp. 9V TaxID=2653132 RepID=UPI0012F35E0F|nr:MmpS family transport accessory protein [Arthrobacter sp. 9V]VXC66875.1 Flagellar hook-associated protein flgK [Arthrobacter sp. 9V]